MGRIRILEKNPLAAEALQLALEENQLAGECQVIDFERENPHIFIRKPGEALPADSGVKDSDIFEKPVRLGAVLDRIRKHIEAFENKNRDAVIAIGPYELDVQNNLFREASSGAETRLTDKETHILRFLAAQNTGFIDRKALLDEVWGYAENVETHTLETHIYRLRQKIEKDPANPEILVTSEQGYRLSM